MWIQHTGPAGSRTIAGKRTISIPFSACRRIAAKTGEQSHYVTLLHPNPSISVARLAHTHQIISCMTHIFFFASCIFSCYFFSFCLYLPLSFCACFLFSTPCITHSTCIIHAAKWSVACRQSAANNGIRYIYVCISINKDIYVYIYIHI